MVRKKHILMHFAADQDISLKVVETDKKDPDFKIQKDQCSKSDWLERSYFSNNNKINSV